MRSCNHPKALTIREGGFAYARGGDPWTHILALQRYQNSVHKRGLIMLHI